MKFYDDPLIQKQLFPFTLTRSVADIRVGISTIREKWLLYQQVLEDVAVPSHLIPTRKTVDLLRAGDKNFLEATLSINYPWQIFEYNDQALRQDFASITAGRTSQPASPGNTLIHPENIFIEEGAHL